MIYKKDAKKLEFLGYTAVMFIATLITGFALGFLYNSLTFALGSLSRKNQPVAAFGADAPARSKVKELLMIEGNVVSVDANTIRIRTAKGPEFLAVTTKHTVYELLGAAMSNQKVSGMMDPGTVPLMANVAHRTDIKTGSHVQVFFLEDIMGKTEGTASTVWIKEKANN